MCKFNNSFLLTLTITFLVFLSHASADGANSENETVIELLIENLSNQNLSIKSSSAKNLAEIGEPTVVPLIQALDSNNSEIRENSAYVLGQIGDERAVDPLIELLGDDSQRVHKAASSALENIGEAALESLVKTVSEENESSPSRLNAIRILGTMGEPAVEPLIQALGGIDGVTAASSLGNIGEPAVLPLIDTLDNDDPLVRAYASKALGKIGDKRAVEPIIMLLEDKDSNVRANAAKALGNIGDERAIEPLTKTLSDNDERVSVLAESALEKIEANDNSGIIATYGKKREFLIEDEWQKWIDELDNIGNGARSDMESYINPNGPVTSYGYNRDGYISVTFLEGSEINESMMDEIYSIFVEHAIEDGISDVPVIFQSEGMISVDIEEDEANFQTPGFTVAVLIMILLIYIKL